MFKKSKRSIRQERIRHSDSDEDEENNNDIQQQIESNNSLLHGKVLAKILPKNRTITSDPDSNSNDDSNSNLSFKSSNQNPHIERKTKLSFEDEEEEDVFVVKKSIYSRRLEKSKKKLLKPIKTESTIVKTLEQKIVPVNITSDDSEKLNVIDLEKENEIIVCPDSEEEEDEHYNLPGNQRREPPKFRSTLERGVIPDAKTIYELKKQRQKMARTVNEEWISLDEDENETNSKGRLVHESDEDKSEDGDLPSLDDEEKTDRIQFGNVDYQNKEKEKFKERFQVTEEVRDEETNKNKSDDDDSESDKSKNDADEESEDEMDRWEREQIRKAVGLPNIFSHKKTDLINEKYMNDDNATLITKLQIIHDNHNVVPIEVDNQETKSYGKYIPPYIKERSKKEDITLDYFEDKTLKSIKELEESIESNKIELDRVCMDLKLAHEDLKSYDSDVFQLTDDYNLYRNMLDFVRNLCNCINDKLSQLEKNEKEAIEVFKSYSQNRLNQHRIDIQDRNSIISNLIMNHKAFCLQYKDKVLNSILDVINFQGDQEKQNRCILREQNAKSLNYEIQDEEEDPIYLEKYYEQLRKIKSELDELFGDTYDEFASIKGIVEKFKPWKKNRLETYKESFISEFMPKFLTYYLRYNLVLWNVFIENNDSKLNLLDMEYIQNLIIYTTFPDSTDSCLIPDLNLIPELIDNTIIPKMITLIEEEVWNPLSTKQTNRLVNFLNLLITNFPTLIDHSENLPILLQKIVLRLEKTIENDIFIPQMIPEDFFLPISDLDVQQKRSHYESSVVSYVIGFFDRQYWQTFNMMTNVILFRNLINDHILLELALYKICFKYLLISVQRSSIDQDKTLDRLQRLKSNIPIEWIIKNPTVQNTLSTYFQKILSKFNNSDKLEKLLSLK